jgi:hypothetical protein
MKEKTALNKVRESWEGEVEIFNPRPNDSITPVQISAIVGAEPGYRVLKYWSFFPITECLLTEIVKHKI